jgi:hypothetical protein
MEQVDLGGLGCLLVYFCEALAYTPLALALISPTPTSFNQLHNISA